MHIEVWIEHEDFHTKCKYHDAKQTEKQSPSQDACAEQMSRLSPKTTTVGEKAHYLCLSAPSVSTNEEQIIKISISKRKVSPICWAVTSQMRRWHRYHRPKS